MEYHIKFHCCYSRTVLKNLLTPLLILLVVVSPINQAFAEELSSSDQSETSTTQIQSQAPQIQTDNQVSPDSQNVPSTDNSDPSAASSPTEGAINERQTAKTNPASSKSTPTPMSMAGTGTSDPSNPSTWSNTSISKTIKPSIDQTTGALTYTYPIDAPTGINGQSPNLSLVYSSQNSDSDSIFGYGWSSTIPYIQRVNKHGTDQLYTGIYTDFSSSVFGELVSKTSTVYVPRSASDIASLTFSSSVWSYTDKNGNVYTFGSTSASRQDDPNNASNIYKWMLDSITDANGNTITYSYSKDQGQIYPDTITYAGIYSIQFVQSSRTDTVTSYKAAFKEKTNYRISQIAIYTNGSWSKKYDIGYTNGDNGVRSMLSTITASARDVVGTVTTLPAEQFSYSHASPWWPDAHSGDDIVGNGSYSGSLNNAQMVEPSSVLPDLNGDSFLDILYGYKVGSTILNGSWINNTQNLTNPNYPNYPSFYNDPFTISTPALGLPNNGVFTAQEYRGGQLSTYPQGYLVGDLNGDLLPDVMQNINAYTWNTYSYPAAIGSYLNINGSSYSADTTAWRTAVPIEDRSQNGLSTTGAHTYLLDINGDTLPDFINDSSGVTKAQLNQGTGFGSNTSSTLPAIPSNFSAYPNVANYLDINGDGLTDYFNLDVNFTNNAAYINNGTLSWTQDNTVKSPMQEPGCFGCDASTFMYVDINGDGLVDIVPNVVSPGSLINYSKFLTYLNTGIGWSPSWIWSVPLSGSSRTLDLNEDGLPDFLQASSNGYDIALSRGTMSDLLQTITFPTGGTTSVTYKPSTQDKDGSGNTLNPHLPFIIQTVNTITTTDPVTSTSATSTYQYAGGSYYYNTPFDRRFAGFETVTEIRPDNTKVITYYHQGNTTNSSYYEYSDNPGKIGYVYRTDILNSSGTLVSRITTEYGSSNPTTGAYFIYPIQKVSEVSGVNTAETYSFNTTTGNMSSMVKYGFVTVTNPLSFTDTGSDKETINYSYATNAGTTIYKPSDITTFDQSSVKVNETRNYYDTLALGSLTKGNTTKIERLKSGTTFVNTQKTYDTYGNVLTSTDERSKVTTYTYDTNNLYVATVSNPLSQTIQYLYDYNTGKPIQTTDQNNFIYQNAYDGFGRLLTQKVPDITTPTTLDTKVAYTYTDTPNAVSIHKTDYLDGSTSRDTYQYFDGLNRLIQERKEAETAGNFNTSDTQYNTLGLVASQSLPYTSNGSAYTSPTTTAALYTNYTYDPLNRVTALSDALGTTSTVYTGTKAAVTDPRGKVKNYYKDAYDNLVKVEEINTGSTYTTTYTWDLNNDLTSITDALGNIRNFTYDNLGRRLTAEDLHASGDTSFGTWTYTYDNAGNLTQSISPLSNTVNYTYDNINRIKTEDYTGVTGTEISYSYDSCTNGIGYRCSVTMLSGTGANTTYTYDANGNKNKEVKTINSTGYTTQWSYDRQGNAITITYPDNAQVKYDYNTAGLVNQIERKESGGSFTNVISNIDYSPTDQPTILAYANGTTTTNTYDANHNYRLSNKQTVNSVPTNLQNIAYIYDADNNITQITDSSNTSASKTVTYTYDDLNRLTQAAATGVASGQSSYTQNFGYNAIGNITSGPVGSYVYNGSTGTNYANPHAATSINSVTNTYDNDGNVLTDGTLTNTWNYKDQLATSTNGTFTRTYKYDENGNRVYSSDGTTVTAYPNKYYTYDGTTKTKDIYIGDTLIATVTKTGSTVTLYYVHTDHLNSTNVTTDAAGAQVQLLDYFPYGTTRINTGTPSNQRQYIGQKFETDTGLNYLNARYYQSTIGRFMSEDPEFWDLGISQAGKQSLSDPQSMNSYSYSGNNPMTKSDPTGKWYKELVWDNMTTLGHGQSWNSFQGELGQATQYLTDHSPAWSFVVDHPLATGAITSVASVPALVAGESAAAAYGMATFPGVGTTFAAQQAFAGTVYSGLTVSSTLAIPELVKPFSKVNPNKPSSFYPAALSVAKEVGMSLVGRQVEAIGSATDIMQIGGMIGKAATNFINNLLSSSNSQKNSDSKKK